MPRLALFRKGTKVTEVPVEPRGAVVGRDGGLDLVLDDPLVSRRHASIEAVGSAWVLRDLGTRNGTFVNGKREWARPLADGDEIQIGPFIVRFVLPKGELAPSGGEARFAQNPSGKLPRLVGASTDPGATQQVGPKTLIRVREESKALMGPHLVEEGPPSQVHALRKAVNVVGSSADAQIRVPSTGKDSAFVVDVRPDGAVVARKSGLLSSLKVNGKTVGEQVLREGDRLECGRAVLVFRTGVK